MPQGFLDLDQSPFARFRQHERVIVSQMEGTMTGIELMYLCGVIGAMTLFATTLAGTTWWTNHR